MKKLLTLLLVLTMAALVTLPALAEEEIVFGYISPGPDTWYLRAAEGFEWGCEKLGIKCITVNSDRDSSKELSNIEYLINEGVAGIGILSFNESGVVTCAQMCGEAIQNLAIRPNIPTMPVTNLSGGNQQKVVVGKWMARDLKVLLVDEPTAGIDVGVKEAIYQILEGLAAKGVLVIVVSSDLQELLRVSTRILVMRKGRIFKVFDSGTVTQEDVLAAASGIDNSSEVNGHE